MAQSNSKNNNSIFVIHPYKRDGAWAFDDAQRGLVREAFVAGADELIELAATRMEIPSADFELGITVFFSANPFPGAQLHIRRRGEQFGGNVYYSPDFQREGWLCPSLLRYFETAPDEIHIQVKRKQ